VIDIPTEPESRGQWRALPRRTRWKIRRTIVRGQAMNDPRLAALAVEIAKQRSRSGGQQTIYAVMSIIWGIGFLLGVTVAALGHGGWTFVVLLVFGANLALNAWMYQRWPEWTKRAGVAVDANTLRATQTSV
jgi:hypothetical protein